MSILRKQILHFLAGAVLLSLTAFAEPAPHEFTYDGFRVPQPGTVLEFPRTHASHPGYKIEWWYLTGHLYASTGERFGYQATFFRNGLKPQQEYSEQPFNNGQLYLTHMAVTDVSGKSFYFEQRFSREGWDAYARTDRLEVRHGNWSLTADPDVTSLEMHTSINSEVQMQLNLKPEKKLLRFGEDGTSRKGPAPEARSFYLTFSRMLTEGSLTIGDQQYQVTGSSWMDHEIASNQLDPNYTGWDWIAIQLKDGWELKAYLLREKDGSPSPYSALIWIDPEGNTSYYGTDSFEWDKPSYWKSVATDASYPISPSIRTTHPVTNQPVEFNFDPVLDDQELNLPGSTYWEGAGRILDASGNETGSAYLELVGYAGRIRGL
ncbi:MAG: lipocalin-like domain-containing protein [Puniceicoccaceae bacterium]